MAKMPPPALPLGYPDRTADCEFWIEPALGAVFDEAVAAGWTPDEVDAAIITLARHRLLARIKKVQPGPQIAQKRAKRAQ